MFIHKTCLLFCIQLLAFDFDAARFVLVNAGMNCLWTLSTIFLVILIRNPNNWDGIFRLKSEEDRCIFHGIKYYSTMPPIKCFLVMEQLSGGLKMIATCLYSFLYTSIGICSFVKDSG